MAAREEFRALLWVAAAVCCFSTSPILVRWAAESLTAFEIAAGRLLLAGGLMAGLARLHGERGLRREEWLWVGGVGLVAAIHFGAYIRSLDFTTVARSLALVYTAPIFAAGLGWRCCGVRLSLRQWGGIVRAVAGVAILAGFEPGLDGRMLGGDLLALLSAVTFAIYSLAGRRRRMPLLTYVGAVYLLGGLWLLPLALLDFSVEGYTPAAVGSVVALAVVPLGIGHTLYNAALRHLPVATANLLATQEITGGILLGIVFLGEIPSWVTLVGVVVAMCGIGVVLAERNA
ncbi:MAG: DMT family transporter [Caldilinea sp.]|nr:DMT family transporter [Caldilinea sp.]